MVCVENSGDRAVIVVRWILGVTMLVAGLLKLGDIRAFQVSIDSFALLPIAASAAVAVFLPWLEILVGGLLVWKKWEYESAVLLTALMLSVFILALLSAWWRGRDPQCGCFGGEASGISWMLIRDALLLVLALWLWASRHRHESVYRFRWLMTRHKTPQVHHE
jgi:hypothetical protein